MPKKKKKDGKPQVNEELKGLDIYVNEFGEVETNMSIERLNEFLNRKVEDKKLKDRPEFKKLLDEERKKAADQKRREQAEKDEDED